MKFPVMTLELDDMEIRCSLCVFEYICVDRKLFCIEAETTVIEDSEYWEFVQMYMQHEVRFANPLHAEWKRSGNVLSGSP